MTESKARALLMWREPIGLLPPGAKRLGIEPVPSVTEVLRIIEGMIATTPRSTWVSRLRSAIGI